MGKNYAVARVEQYTKDSIGKAERHIERKNKNYANMNVDLSRTDMNVHFKSAGDLTYNSHLDKLVENGAVSLRGLKKDAKVFDEMIFDVNTAYFEERGGYEYARAFFEEVFHFAEKEYGAENIVSAVMHADELNTALTERLGYPVYHYHMHVVALPVVAKEVRWSKRCKDPALVGTVKEVIHQVSHSKKWASLKTTDEQGRTQLIKSYSLLQDRFFEYMRDAGFEDFERGERGSTAQHLSVTEFKVKKETERLENLQSTAQVAEEKLEQLSVQEEAATEKANAAQERVEHLVPKMQKVEELARAFTNDAAQVLPPPDKLESAKSYREKKAMPIFHKIIGVLRNVFSRYLDLKYEYERLQERYRMAVESVSQLKETIKQLHEEKAGLSAVAEKYHALCRGFGKETVEAHVQEVLEREAMEKQQKKQVRRHHDRDSR